MVPDERHGAMRRDGSACAFPLSAPAASLHR